LPVHHISHLKTIISAPATHPMHAYIRAPRTPEVAASSLSWRQMLKQLISLILIHVPNNKTSGMGNIWNNYQVLGKITHRRCQRILGPATIDNPTFSASLTRPDESRFVLVSSASVPQVYQENVLRTMLRQGGLRSVSGKNRLHNDGAS
jgi:hypothetical protein